MKTTTISSECVQWSKEEFGAAALGDKRLKDRLFTLGARLVAAPAGTVTKVFREDADRQGAYGFLSNERFTYKDLAEASYEATMERLGDEPFVWVATDGSAVSLSDTKKNKGLGSVGSRKKGALGIKTMSAEAISPDGEVLGLLGQRFWVRGRRAAKSHAKRKVHEKETQHWLEVMGSVRERFNRRAATAQPWFVIDREGDSWPVLLDGLDCGGLFTVRASWNRRLKHGPGLYLWEALHNSPIAGHYSLHVRPGPKRQERVALMEVRSCAVTLELRNQWTNKRFEAPLYAVWARESSTPPAGDKPLEWMLLTSHVVQSFEDAALVLFGYTQRWKVEDFHKCWKSAACDVEATQLRSTARILKWAVLLAAVAMRIERIKTLSRTQPELPASEEFSQEEIDAVLLLKNQPAKLGTVPLLGQLVLWLAELGGYTGKSSGGPPGTIVLRRGLQEITPVIAALRILRNSGLFQENPEM